MVIPTQDICYDPGWLFFKTKEDRTVIRTKIFTESDESNFDCMDKMKNMINSLIKDNGIKKDDILEYRTKNWCSYEPYATIYYIEVVISWWVEEKEEEKK